MVKLQSTSSHRFTPRRAVIVGAVAIPVLAVAVIGVRAADASISAGTGPDGGPVLPNLGTVAPPAPTVSGPPTVEPSDPPSAATVPCKSGGEVANKAAAVVRQALEFRLKINVPDLPNAKADLSANDRAALTARGNARVPQLFSGDEAQRELNFVAQANSGSTDGTQVRPLGGGVSAYSCTGATVSASTVQIEATATTWARMAHPADGTVVYAQPSNVVNVKATVTIGGGVGGMTVSTLTWEFAPGSEP